MRRGWAVAVIAALLAVSCSSTGPSTRTDDASTNTGAAATSTAGDQSGAAAGRAEASADAATDEPERPTAPAAADAPTVIDDGRPAGELLVQRRDGVGAWVSHVDLSTEAETRLSPETVSASGGVWSPDGSQIAWAEQAVGEPGVSIQVVDASGANPQTVSSGQIETFPTWSPDCTAVAFSLLNLDDGAGELIISDIDGSDRRSVWWGPGIQAAPDWSPDGSTLAYQSERGGATEIALVGVDGTDEQVLTDNTVGDTSPRWSPDGTRLAFASRVNERKHIFILDVAAGSTEQLTRGNDGGGFPVWSPDGEWIAYEGSDTNVVVRSVTSDDRYELDVVGQPTSWRAADGSC